jgi:hypothetical protein
MAVVVGHPVYEATHATNYDVAAIVASAGSLWDSCVESTYTPPEGQ